MADNLRDGTAERGEQAVSYSRRVLRLTRMEVLWPLAALAIVLASCSEKREAKSQLIQLERTFPTNAIAAMEGDPGTYVQAALNAVQQNDYAGGVLALQAVQQMPRMTAEQLQAVHAAMQTLTADLVARAGRGDAKAEAQLAAIERSRSQ